MRPLSKQLHTTLILVLFCFSYAAQTIDTGHVKIDLKDFGISIKTRAYDTYSKSEKKLFVAFVDSVTLNILSIDDKLERTKDSISYKFPTAGYTIQRAEINSTHINYLVKNQTQSLRLLKYDRKQKKWKMGKNLFISGEKYLCSFSHNGSFLVFNFLKNQNTIRVYTAGMNEPKTLIDFDLSNFKLGENTLAQFIGKNKKGIKVIHNESQNELFASINNTKAYYNDGKVSITIEDTLTESTGVIRFDLASKKHSIDYFTAGRSNQEEGHFMKSALSEGHFAMIHGDLTRAKISIWDLNSKILKSKMYLYADSLIQFKNTDNLISPKQALSIEKLKSRVLLQKFIAGTGAIYLKEKEHHLELVVGFSLVKNRNKMRQKRNNGNPQGRGGGAGKQRKLDRSEARKIKALGLSKSYLNYEANRTSCFISVFNKNTAAFDAHASYKNSFEGIKTFKSSIEPTAIGVQIVTEINDAIWYGYFNKGDEALHLHKIN